MRKAIFFLAILVGLISCARVDYDTAARGSEPLRLLLLTYYETNGAFPASLDSLKAIDPEFAWDGILWNGWNYSANMEAHQEAYGIWTYPGPTRQSLWFVFVPGSSAKTRWYLDNENGTIIRLETIALLPQERELLKRTSKVAR